MRATCRTPGSRSRAPRRSTAPGTPRRPGRGPTGTSFRERVLGEVRGGAAQDLVLHLETTRLASQLHQLRLLRAGQPVADPVVDISLAHPAVHRLDRDV